MPALALNLKRDVTFVERVLEQSTVAQHDSLLSESRELASSESDSKELLINIPAGNRADHMELVDGLAELGNLSPPLEC